MSTLAPHIHQDVSEIACLEDCVRLERVFIVEGCLTRIQGLQTLRNLRELFLYSNRITHMEGLEQLTNLEVRVSFGEVLCVCMLWGGVGLRMSTQACALHHPHGGPGSPPTWRRVCA